MTSYPQRQTFLLGSNKLQLELMSLFIEERTDVSCTIVPALSEVPCCPESKHLILYDCKEWKDYLKDISESDFKKHLCDNFFVLINMINDMGIETEALSHGVRGFLYEKDSTDTLLKMIHAVFSSEIWLSRHVMTEYIQLYNKKIPKYNNTPLSLTTREVEVLTAITMGRSNELIAEKLCIIPHTVKTNVYHIFKKIHVRSKMEK